ncbi:MAG: methyltransferase [Gammaproteobacteria bacterium]|nr:methyltransferase [Gammaproteobacteria bacterium]
MFVLKISRVLLILLYMPSFYAYSNDLSGANYIKIDSRTASNVLRDSYRNPAETLSFFRLSSDMTVIELSPGGGWYTEILAPYLKGTGKLIAVHFNPESGNYRKRSRQKFEEKIQSSDVYEEITVLNLDAIAYSPPGSVDAVLTFRNLHNWIGPQIESIFSNAYKSLRSGGLLGVVEHRANPGTSLEEMKKSGYVTEEWAIEEAQKQGFVLVERSEINANPNDTKDHPRGVWTLPPSLVLKELDREKYKAIGESDRMTLLFKKP